MWSTGYYGYLSDYLWWWVVLISLIIHTWCFFRLFPKQKLAWLRLVLGNALVGLCMLVFVGLLAESYLRFLVVETDSFGVTLTSKRWFAIYPRRNSLMHRDKEWAEEKPEGMRRIAFLGDSFTYGWGIKNEEDRFTNLIQQRFDRMQPGAVEVMNWAWGGWGTRDHIKATYEAITEYHTDEIVLCYLPNDIETLIPTTSDFDPIRPPKPKYFNTSNSFLFDFLFHRIYAGRLPTIVHYYDWLADAYTDPEIWRKQEERFALIIQHCRVNDVTLRVVLIPFIRWPEGRYDPERIQAQVRAFFEANGVPVVDLLPAIAPYNEEELVVNPHDHHPSELAHAAFAEAIWNAFYAPAGE
jgi:hypothetical protein